MTNYININHDELDIPIYRIINIDRFFKFIKNKKNCLVNPKLWDDPYENLLRNTVYLTGDYENPNVHSTLTYEKCIYGQCWTFSRENDLLWRSYAPKKDGVMIQSTIRKVIDSLLNSKSLKEIRLFHDKNPDPIFNYELDFYIGKVQYLSKNEIIKNIKEKEQPEIESLLLKRKAFYDEKEVRLLLFYLPHYTDVIINLQDDTFFYDFDIEETIDNVIFDPRISNYHFNALKDYTRKLGYNKEISKIDTYEMPEKIKVDKRKKKT